MRLLIFLFAVMLLAACSNGIDSGKTAEKQGISQAKELKVEIETNAFKMHVLKKGVIKEIKFPDVVGYRLSFTASPVSPTEVELRISNQPAKLKLFEEILLEYDGILRVESIDFKNGLTTISIRPWEPQPGEKTNE